MRVLCAWCAREHGDDTVAVDVPPLGDDGVSHGLCNEHALALLLASRYPPVGTGLPPRRLRLIVRSDRPDVYQWLAGAVDTIDDVEIVVDRRSGERRRARIPVEFDRRRSERRDRHTMSALEATGWAGVIEAPTAP